MSLHLVEPFVNQLKSQGVFDKFRKECLSEVDTKPAYQNLRSRVQSVVEKFQEEHQWNPSLNRNQLRESLRKCIVENTNLDTGINRIVEQVVNPKIVPSFLPVIERALEEFMEQHGVSEGPGDSDDSGLGGGGSGSHGGGGKGMGRSGSSGMGGSTSVSGAKSFEGTSVEGSNQEPVQTRKASMKEPSFGKEKHHSDRHRNHKRNGDKERKRKETRTTSLEDYIHQAKRRTIPAHILASDEAFMKWLPPSALPPRHHRETKYPRAPRVDWDDIQHGPLVLLLDHKVVTGPVVSDDLSRKRKAAELVHGDAFLPTKMATPSPSSPYAGEHMNGLVYQKGRGSNGHVNLPSTAKLNGNHHMLPPLRLQQVNGFDHQDPSYKRSSLPGTPHSAGTPLSASIKDGDRHGEFFAALNTPAEAYIKKKKKKTRSGGEKDIQKRGGGRPNKVRTTTPAAIVS